MIIQTSINKFDIIWFDPLCLLGKLQTTRWFFLFIFINTMGKLISGFFKLQVENCMVFMCPISDLHGIPYYALIFRGDFLCLNEMFELITH